MTRIGPSDQLLLLLQERLKTLGKERAGKTARTGLRDSSAIARASTVAAFDSLDPDERRRTIVRGVLVQHFGESIANDPAFATLASDVTRLMTEDEASADLIDRALGPLSR